MLAKNVKDRLLAVDPDRYRAALFAAAPERDALHVLYAFHYELAKIPELVSEPLLGQIRYQWWRDVIEEIYTDMPVRAHEITTPLAHILRKRDVPRYHIDRLIHARERDMDGHGFPDIKSAQTYAKETSGTLMQIAAHIIGGEPVSYTHLTLPTIYSV